MDEFMEWDERIFEDRYGSYTMLFSNFNGLDMDGIGKIFAQFGNYLSIRRAGNERGIHFVTYETYVEAKNAVDHLENHPDIQLKVYRKNKFDNRRHKKFNDINNINDNRCRSNRYVNYAKQCASSMTYRLRAANRAYDDHNARQKYVENGEKTFVNRWLDENVDNMECRESSTYNEINASDDGLTKAVDDDAIDYCIMNARIEDEKSPLSWNNVQNYLPPLNNNQDNDQSASIETIAATINTEVEQTATYQDLLEDEAEVAVSIKIEDDESVVTMQESTSSIIQEVVAKASDVIVGNVDVQTSEAYLLHLFNKYEPIAVSQLVPLPRGNVHYCYVYFKNTAIAEKVERQFDKFYLAGRQLVVQRPNRLIASYLQQI